jgi:sugar phosphate isomerase/epimerase
MKIGAQMYTVRSTTQNLGDLSTTLKRIADIGYTTVQVSGVCSYEPQWMKDELKKAGLECVITHPETEAFYDAKKLVADHNIYNCKYIGLGSMPGGAGAIDAVDSFIEKFRPIGKAIKENGAYMMYHNHHYEFTKDANGIRVLDKIIEGFTPDELGFTLDTYWVQVGGGDPAAWLEKLKDRVPCIHLKDLVMNKVEQKMAPVGHGNMNFERIIAAAENAGTEYMLVEQDYCYDEDPFVCLEKSYKYLKSLGLN